MSAAGAAALLLSFGHTLVTTLIPAANGTIITDALSTWATTANAFDGTTVQTEANSAAANAHSLAPVGTNYIGKDWGAGQAHRVTKLILYGPSNGFLMGNGGVTAILFEGSNDGSSWTTLDSFNSSGANADVVTRTGTINATTAYRFHRVSAQGNGVNGCAVTEMQLFRDL